MRSCLSDSAEEHARLHYHALRSKATGLRGSPGKLTLPKAAPRWSSVA